MEQQKKSGTYKQQCKLDERNKFDITPVKDFVTDSKRSEYGHICNQCDNKRHCKKQSNAIILKCDDFKTRQNGKSYKK